MRCRYHFHSLLLTNITRYSSCSFTITPEKFPQIWTIRQSIFSLSNLVLLSEVANSRRDENTMDRGLWRNGQRESSEYSHPLINLGPEMIFKDLQRIWQLICTFAYLRFSLTKPRVFLRKSRFFTDIIERKFRENSSLRENQGFLKENLDFLREDLSFLGKPGISP